MSRNEAQTITARALASPLFRDVCALLALVAFGSMVLAWGDLIASL